MDGRELSSLRIFYVISISNLIKRIFYKNYNFNYISFPISPPPLEDHRLMRTFHIFISFTLASLISLINFRMGINVVENYPMSGMWLGAIKRHERKTKKVCLRTFLMKYYLGS